MGTQRSPPTRDETHQRWPPETRRAGGTPPPDHTPEGATARSPLLTAAHLNTMVSVARAGKARSLVSLARGPAEAEKPQHGKQKHTAKKKPAKHTPHNLESGSGSCLNLVTAQKVTGTGSSASGFCRTKRSDQGAREQGRVIQSRGQEPCLL